MRVAARLEKKTDAELVAGSLAGDRQAFAAIVDRYQGLVTGVAFNCCQGDLHRSEDIAQEAFVTAWVKLENLKQTSQLSAWLCGIARNVAVNAARKHNRQESGHELAALPGCDQDPAEQLISREQQRLLWESLEGIPEKYREPMILFYRQQQSTADVARALGLSEFAIRKRLERGRSLLRDQIAAMVEDTLVRSAPSTVFTAAVVAALPALTAKTAMASAGGSVAAGVAGTKLVAAFAFFIGPLLGFLGGLYGSWQTYKQARSAGERRFVLKMTCTIFALVIAFIALQLNIQRLRPLLSQTQYAMVIGGTWAVYAAVITALAGFYNRRHRRIREADGTGQDASEYQSGWDNPWSVRASIGGGILGGVSWLVLMAGQAGDWLSVVLICLVGEGLYLWSTRKILAQGASIARRVLLIVMAVVLLMTAVAVNLRFNDWLAALARLESNVQVTSAPHIPLWQMNVLLIIIGACMTGPILVTQDVRRSKRISP